MDDMTAINHNKILDDCRNKKIFVLGPSLNAVSGVSTHLKQLFGSKLSGDFELIHFQVGREGRKESGFRLIRRFLFSPIELLIKILIIRPVLIHLNSSMDPKAFWRDITFLIIAKMTGVKTVFQIHGGVLPQNFYNNKRVLSSIFRKLLALPDAIVVLASSEKDAYENFSKIKRLDIIPNAIELNEYCNSKDKNYESNVFEIGYIGRLVLSKGIRELIEAIGILIKEKNQNNMRLSIAGSGPDEEWLKCYVSESGLDNSVRFLGAVFGKDKKKFWEQTHVFVFPTFHPEGLPYTILESIASGTPVITTRVGGIPDTVQDNVHGFFVQPHDPIGIANALKVMMSDKMRMRKMSVKCVERAQDHYSINRLSRQFNKLYTELLS